MKQSRRMSAVEAVSNVAVGYALAVIIQIAAFPLFGIESSVLDNLGLALIFTVASIARSYSLRRAFEAWRYHDGMR